MRLKRQLILLFIPLVLAFAGLAMGIQDLKHPVVKVDQCHLVGRGKSIQSVKDQSTMLYQRSGKPEDDIAFTCKSHGSVVVNDHVPYPLKPGQPIELTVKAFKYLPTRYYFEAPIDEKETPESAGLSLSS